MWLRGLIKTSEMEVIKTKSVFRQWQIKDSGQGLHSQRTVSKD